MVIGGDATLNRIGESGLVMQADAFFGSVLGTALGLQAPERPSGSVTKTWSS